MKKAIRTASLLLAVSIAAVGFSGCADKKYNAYDRTGERYDYYLPDYVEVGKYSEIEVPDISFTPSVELVQNTMARALTAYGERTYDVQRPAADGDVVDLITTAKIDGEIYTPLTFEKGEEGFGQSTVLGTYEFDVPEIDDSIIGMSAGESKTVTFTLSDPYYRNYTYSGKEVTMEIYLNYVDEVIAPADNDEFYLQHYSYTRAEYQAKVTSSLTEQYNGYIEGYKQDLTWQYILNHSKLLKYPEKEKTELYDNALNSYRSTASQQNKTLLEYVQDEFGYESLDELYDYLTKYSEDKCYEEMILYYIARCENIYLLKDYYESQVLEMTEDYEIKELTDAEDFLDYYYGLDNIKENLRLKYVKQWIADNAVIREDVTTFVNDLNK